MHAFIQHFSRANIAKITRCLGVVGALLCLPCSPAYPKGQSAIGKTACAGPLTQGQTYYYTSDGCHESLADAEAAMRAEIDPNNPKGRHLLEQLDTQRLNATDVRYIYGVKDREGTKDSEYYHSVFPQFYTCPDDGSYPLSGNWCHTQQALEDYAEGVLVSNGPGGGYCFADWEQNLDVSQSFWFTIMGIEDATFQGIDDSRWAVLTKSNTPAANNPLFTKGYAQGGGGTCGDWNPTSHLGLQRWDIYLCDEYFTAKIGATNAVWPLICENNQTGIIESKVYQKKSCEVGKPCVPATGQKLRHEIDFNSDGFVFERSYHSANQMASYAGIGDSWTHNYDTHLLSVNPVASPPPGGGSPVDSMYVVDERGDIEQFQLVGVDTYRSINESGKLLRKRGSPLVWELQTDERRTLRYDSVRGRLISIAYRDQPSRDLALTYDALPTKVGQNPVGRLLSVQDARGRKLDFEYNGWRLNKIRTPDGSEYIYSMDTAGRLAAVSYPGGGVRSFVYDNPDFPSHLTDIFDENGDHYGEFAYDSIGRVVSSKLLTGIPAAPYAEGVTLTYNAIVAGVGTTTVTTALGEQATYSFGTDLFQRLGGISDSAGSTSTVYRPDGRIDYTLDKKGVRTAYEYDATHQTVRIDAQNSDTQPANAVSDERKTETSWDNALDVVAERRVYRCSALGTSPQPCSGAGGSELWQLESLSRFAYNTRGQVTARCEVDPLNATALAYTCGSGTNAPSRVRQTRTSYCEASDVTAGTCALLGLVKSTDGARTDVADTTAFTYYAADHSSCASAPTNCTYRKGDLWKVTNALNQITEYVSYDGAGRVKRIKDANGVLTDLTYHARGWLQTRTVRNDPNGVPNASLDATTTLTYDNVGQVTRITQPDGAYINYSYDDAHRLTDIVDNLGNKISYTLDAAGNRIAEQTRDPANALTRTLGRVYNSLGQLHKLLNAQSAETVFTYDANGNQDTVTDALTRVTDSDVDPLNRLIQSTDALMGNTKYRYDARDNLEQVTDAKTLSTIYTYDGLNDLRQLNSPDTGITNYTYDSAGNRVTQADARGVVSTYSYDALNRLTAISYPTAANNVTFNYDEGFLTCASDEQFRKGRLTSFTDPSGNTKLCYDKRGNVKRKIAVVNGVTLTTTWGHTLADRISSLAYPSGTSVTYTRDTLGRITGISVTPAGGSAQTLITAVSYYPFGPVKQITWGGTNATSQRNYDLNYWIDSINSSQTAGLDLDFALDPVGNITGLSDVLGGMPPNNTYVYDALYRLQDINAPGADIEAYTYDAIGNRLTKQVGTGPLSNYVYGATSHRLMGTQGGVTRVYDPAGNTTKFDQYSLTAPTLAYGERNRFDKLINGLGALSTEYAHNARGERVYKRDIASPKANSRSFIYDESGRLLVEANRDGVAIQEYLWLDDLPVGLIMNGAVYHIQPDHLGSPRKVVQASNNTVIWDWPILNNAFGEAAPNQDPDGNGTAFTLNLRFPGQYFDVETGLHYNYFRDYEPGTGRYVESDPIGLRGGINTYAYVGGMPLDTIDRLGLSGVRICENRRWVRDPFGGEYIEKTGCRWVPTPEPTPPPSPPATPRSTMLGLACRMSCAAGGAAICAAVGCGCTLGSVVTVGGLAIPCSVAIVASCAASGGAAVACSEICPP